MSSAVAVAIGAVVAALAIEIVPPVGVLCAAGVLGCLAIVGRGRTRTTWLAAVRWLPVALGVAAIALRAWLTPASVAVPLPTGDGPWIGTVISVGAEHDGSRPAVVRLEEPAGLTVAATLPWFPAVGADDQVRLTGSLRSPPPGDYGRYLARIGASGTIRADHLDVLPPRGGLDRAVEELRRSAGTALERALPEPEAGLAAGILIGLRDHVDRSLAADFTTAGVSHVVAISGWNIAIVATSIGAVAGSLRRRRRAVLTGLAIIAYVIFVGPSPSVVRAGAMAGLVLLARELGRPSRATAALAWAVTGLLVVDPGWVDDAGFRLSVLATAGLMAWGTILATWLAGSKPGRLRGWLAESLGVSLAAQAATLPVILLEFGRLSLVSPVVNLAVVPLVAPAMAAGAIALVAGAIVGLGAPAGVATIAGLPAWALLAAIIGAVRIGAGIPLASVTLAPPWDLLAAIASAAMIVVGAKRGRAIVAWLSSRLARRPAPRGARTGVPRSARSPLAPTQSRPARSDDRHQRIAAAALAASVLALGLAIAHRPSGVVSVTVLDVGQGDGILVESGTGLRLLVDGGPDPNRILQALDERLPPWDRRIDILVLTHPHEDHVAGLARLLARYRVGRVAEPGMIGPGPGYAAWQAVLTNGPPHGTLATGDRFQLGPISFRVLWPDPGRVPEHPADGGTAINNVSIVLLGTFEAHSFLLAGDIEQGVDAELLARGLPGVELLKVAHHGSKTASTAPFLDAVHPKVAVVSAGLGNPYGHPAPSTIDRLRAITPRTYRTDLDGTVEVRFEADALRVRTSGPRRAATVPHDTAASTAAGAGTVSPEQGRGIAFACAISAGDPGRAVPAQLPVVAETPDSSLAGIARDVVVGPGNPWLRDRLPLPSRTADDVSYHRADDRTGPFRGGGKPPERRRRERAARVPLGRRQLRPGRRRGDVSSGRGALPRRRPDPLASGLGGGRAGPGRR